MKLLPLLFSLGIAAAAVESPSVGYIRAADGSIVRVTGISGAFITTGTGEGATVALSFSGSLGFLKLDTSVQVVNGTGELLGESDAPAGPALFGFNANGDAGVAYYPATRELRLFANGQWQAIPFNAPDGVISVALKDADHVLVAAASDQLTVLTIRTSDGATEAVSGAGLWPAARFRPGKGTARHIALITAGGTLLFGRGGALIYRDANGSEQTIDTPGPITAMTQMGAGWVHLQTDSRRNLALRLLAQPKLYEIPEVSQ